MLDTGAMLPPLIILKSNGQVPAKLSSMFENEALLYSNRSGWITEFILTDYLTKVWLNIDIPADKKLFLVMDKCTVHTKDSIIKTLKSQGSEVEFIPGGCTGLLQPLDVCINKPLKDHIRAHFNIWFDNYGCSEANQTKKGNLRPPPSEKVISWMLDGCKHIDKQLIKKSFKYCGKLNFIES